MAAPQLPVNFDPAFFRVGVARFVIIKNIYRYQCFDNECVFFYFSLVGSALQQYSGAAEVFHFFMPYVCTQVSSCLLSVKTPPPTSQPQPPPPVTLYERCL